MKVKLNETTKIAEQLKANIKNYITETIGEPTLRDIIAELEKPGRDPRAQFTYATFRDDIKEMRDLHVGMELEGVVTNVANFGAFVDLGVHQDGLIHVSQLADRFISDPTEVVKVGQVVKVRVLEVNMGLKRIGLSMRAPDGNAHNTGSTTGSNNKENSRDTVRSPISQRPAAKVQPKSHVQSQSRVQPEKQIEQKTEKQLGSAPTPSLEDLKAKFGRKI